jgi:hypothetical protein
MIQDSRRALDQGMNPACSHDALVKVAFKKMDERFQHVLTDPRFRRQKKTESRVKIDARFSQVLSAMPNVSKNGSKRTRQNRQETKSSSEDVARGGGFTAADFAPSHATVDRFGRAIASSLKNTL